MSYARTTGRLFAMAVFLAVAASPATAAASTTLGYATFLGGQQTDRVVDVAADAAGNAYVLSRTNSKQFPTTSGAFDRRLDSGDDVAVSKLDPSGEQLLWSTYLGGSGFECSPGCAIAVDGAGAVYVAGSTTSADFPTTPGAPDRTAAGNEAFVAKLDPSGSSLEYATLLGGAGHDSAFGVAVDGSGAAYVTGTTDSSDFPATSGAPSPEGDAFVAKLDPSGERLVYSSLLGASGDETGFAVQVDGDGAAYVAGDTTSPDFPVTSGALAGGRDGFVARLAETGDALTYATFLGGSGLEHADDLDLGPDGAAFVTGSTRSADFPTTAGAFDTTHNGPGVEDLFVTQIDPAGASLAYSTFVGGAGFDAGGAIAVGADGSAVVAGSTGAADFPTTAGAFDRSLGGAQDAVVTQLAPDGSALRESTYLGGAAADLAEGVALAGGDALVGGSTSSTDFPVTSGAFDTRFNGKDPVPDGFVARLSRP